MEKTHNIEINKNSWESLVYWGKNNILTLNTSDFQTWDIIEFNEEILWKWCETKPREVIWRKIKFKITHILNSAQFPTWLKDNYVILSVKKIK